jgi:hypothetical protein
MIYSDSDRGFDEILDSLQPLHKSDSLALKELFREGSDVMSARFAGLIAEHRVLDEHEIHSVRDAVRRLVKRWRPYPFSTAGKKALDRMPRSIKANIFRKLPDDLLDELTKKSDNFTTSALQRSKWRGDQPRKWRFGRARKKLADGRPAMRRFVDLPLSQAVRALRSLLIRVNEHAILDASRFPYLWSHPANFSIMLKLTFLKTKSKRMASLNCRDFSISPLVPASLGAIANSCCGCTRTAWTTGRPRKVSAYPGVLSEWRIFGQKRNFVR